MRLGHHEKKIIDIFKNSNRKKAEATELVSCIKNDIKSLDFITQINNAQKEKKESNLYKSVLRALSSLEKKGFIKKSYKNIKAPKETNKPKNRRILIIIFKDKGANED